MNCRGGPPWPPPRGIQDGGGHGGPPLQICPRILNAGRVEFFLITSSPSRRRPCVPRCTSDRASSTSTSQSVSSPRHRDYSLHTPRPNETASTYSSD